MKKAITLLAVAGLSMAHIGDFGDNFLLDTRMNHGHNLPKHTERPRYDKLITADDENELFAEYADEELAMVKSKAKNSGFGLSKGAHSQGKRPENDMSAFKDIKGKAGAIAVDDEDELFAEYADEEFAMVKSKAKNSGFGLSKGAHSQGQHSEHDMSTVKDKIKDWGKAMRDGLKTYRTAGFDDEEGNEEDEEFFIEIDNELFSVQKVGQAVGTGVSKTANFIKEHPKVIKNGINIGKDIASKNAPKLVKDGIKTYHDIRHDDELGCFPVRKNNNPSMGDFPKKPQNNPKPSTLPRENHSKGKGSPYTRFDLPLR